MKQRKDGRYVKAIVLTNGKRKYFYSDETTERRATKDINDQILAFRVSEQNKTLFNSVAEEWKEEHFQNVRANSVAVYDSYLHKATEYFDGVKIDSIEPLDVAEFAKKLNNEGLSSNTVSLALMVLGMVFKYAVIHRYVTSNPCQYVKGQKKRKKKKRKALTPESNQYSKGNKENDNGFFVYFLMMTGCRRCEALALRYSDVDFENKRISISKTLIFRKGTHVQELAKTDAGAREIPISTSFRSELESRMTKKDGYIFSGKSGEYMKSSEYARMWRKYKASTGLSIVPHQLRHQFATFLYDAGVDVKSAQKILGHARATTTMDIYTHLSQEREDDSAKKIDRFFSD